MKNKSGLMISIFQLVLGSLAIVCFAVIIANGESLLDWIVTLILAAAFVVFGIAGIVRHFSQK